jgi:enoyl-CoA hydratase
VAVVTLQRPEKRNALSVDLRVELADAFSRLSGEAAVGCIVLTGAGSAFCAGMDVTQFGGDEAHRRLLVETSTGAFEAVGSCPRPVVAAVNGPALAGGFALALLCDLRVADASATFGFPELPRGIPPSYAAARAALAPAVAAQVCLTGRVFGAEEAARLGAVNEVVPEGEALERALGLAAAVAATPRAATLETKRRILLERQATFGPLFAEEIRVFRETLLGPGDDAA